MAVEADLPDDQTKDMDYSLLPDNTVTVIVKHEGKIYANGAAILDLKPETPDEDLESTIRAVRGLMNTTLRTLFYTLAARSEEDELPE